MSLFGIFNGWTTRKKGLFEKLHEDVRDSVFQVFGIILRDYKLKLDFLRCCITRLVLS